MLPYINFNVYRLKPNPEGGMIAEGLGGACYEEHANLLRDKIAQESGVTCTILVIAGDSIRSIKTGFGRNSESA
jgi:hypothetical protein